MAGLPDETGPIDFDVLDDIGSYLAGSARFESVTFRPPYAPDSLVCHYDPGFYPTSVEEAFLEVKWYVNDDFKIHYQEHWQNGQERKCRWDRHPNNHNSRDHYHPLPDAATPGTDANYAEFWKDVLSTVVESVDERIDSFWK